MTVMAMTVMNWIFLVVGVVALIAVIILKKRV